MIYDLTITKAAAKFMIPLNEVLLSFRRFLQWFLVRQIFRMLVILCKLEVFLRYLGLTSNILGFFKGIRSFEVWEAVNFSFLYHETTNFGLEKVSVKSSKVSCWLPPCCVVPSLWEHTWGLPIYCPSILANFPKIGWERWKHKGSTNHALCNQGAVALDEHRTFRIVSECT